MSRKRKNGMKHMGSSIDDFLKEEGIFEAEQAEAIREVVAWQLEVDMGKQKICKNKMAAPQMPSENANQKRGRPM